MWNVRRVVSAVSQEPDRPQRPPCRHGLRNHRVKPRSPSSRLGCFSRRPVFGVGPGLLALLCHIVLQDVQALELPHQDRVGEHEAAQNANAKASDGSTTLQTWVPTRPSREKKPPSFGGARMSLGSIHKLSRCRVHFRDVIDLRDVYVFYLV